MAFPSCRPFNSIPNTNNAWFFLLMLVWWFLVTITLSPPHVACISSGILCKDIERKALLTLKAGLVDKAGRLSSWSDDNPNCCNWKGISCSNHTGHVLKLELGNPFQDFRDFDNKLARSRLGGEISSSILELKFLEYLDLSINDFNHSKIPPFLGSLEKLRYLNLSYSSFSGILPSHLGNLSSLQYLHIGYNSGLEAGNLQWLTGMSSLKYVNLNWVDLSEVERADDWFKAINMLPMLLELHLRQCRLSNLPMSMDNHPINFTSLSTLDLYSNNFSSSLSMPPWLFNLTGLVDLQLSGCSLHAPFIPHEIGKLVALQQLDLSGNERIGGQLPASLGNLTNLVMLNLGNNRLEGRIPVTFGHLCKLQELDMGFNKIEGDIHEFIDGLEICSGDPTMEILDLSGNRLHGTLPSSLGSLVNLVSLHLSRNSFWGSIPTTIESLHLRNLFLSSNKMNGTIAEMIRKLKDLERLDLSHNQWRGQMLNESHFEKNTKLETLDLSSTSSKEEGNFLVLNMTQEWLPPFRRSIYELRLDGVKMSSKKFPRWTQTLHRLESLSLQDCGISDSIPTGFWKSCPNIIELYMSNNAISIDATFKNIGHLLPPLVPAGNLGYLYLANNSGGGGGEIPSNIHQLAPSLQYLDLSSNSLSGEIPRSICQIRYLSHLSLRNNLLTGDLTHLHWENLTFLSTIDLSNNRLVGKIPESLGNFSYFGLLSLHDNHLEGEIPSFTDMRVIDLGGNKLTGNIPPTLANHNPGLLVFRLQGNMFSGTIPLEFCLLSQLQNLDLARNSFHGTIPWCLGNLSTSDAAAYNFPDGITLVVKGREYKYDAGILSLVHLVDLSHNNLSGNIPESLMNLTAMQTLNLSMNHLTGEIPSNIGLLRALETLDLSQNHLFGPIPSSISDISSLNYLNLSHNNLSGRIPLSRQLQTLDTNSSSYVGNPLLCGVPLPTKCPGDGTPNGHQGEGKEMAGHGKRTFDLDKWGFILSLIAGFVVGFWGVCGSLVLKASWRQAYFGYLVGVKEKLIVAVVVNFSRLQRKMGISE